jgi:hypothetical protein
MTTGLGLIIQPRADNASFLGICISLPGIRNGKAWFRQPLSISDLKLAEFRRKHSHIP